METIERAFADAANNMDNFLNQERAKLNDPHLSLETCTMMVNLGFPYGDSLIGRVRGAAQQAISSGLQSNRFTKQSLPALEQRWNQQKADSQARLANMQKPAAPVLPAVPFSQTFQPFRINRPKVGGLSLEKKRKKKRKRKKKISLLPFFFSYFFQRLPCCFLM